MYESSHIPGHVGPPEARGFYCPLGGQCPEMNVESGLVECGGNVVHTVDSGDSFGGIGGGGLILRPLDTVHEQSEWQDGLGFFSGFFRSVETRKSICFYIFGDWTIGNYCE